VPARHGSGTVAPTPQCMPTVQLAHAVSPPDGWYVPAAQSVHALRPAASANWPGAHGCVSIERGRQALPAGHCRHADCAASGWYSPARQPTQLPAPVDATLPASHATGAVAPAMHSEPSGHVWQMNSDVAFSAPLHEPAAHRTGALAPASGPQYVPAAQPMHTVAPSNGAWLPAGHGVHTPVSASAAKVPGAHGAMLSAPVTPSPFAKKPAGATSQSSTLLRGVDARVPVPAMNRPAGQSVGSFAPSSQYEPNGHVSHAVAFGAVMYLPLSHATHALSPPVAAREPGGHAIGSLERARQ